MSAGATTSGAESTSGGASTSGAGIERRAVRLAFAAHFALMASYYVLRPLRDTVAVTIGVGGLRVLFTATFIGTVVAVLLYAKLMGRFRLSRLLPAVFGFLSANILVFAGLFQEYPQSPLLAAGYYVWFSVTNLFMVSLFWSLMTDVFSSPQAMRWFAPIAAGGALGAIAGPLVTRIVVGRLGLAGLLMVAAGGLVLFTGLLARLIDYKSVLRRQVGAQSSRLDRPLGSGVLQGFKTLIQSPYARHQALFMLLMTWINTIAYFVQTDLIAHTYTDLAARARAIADMDLAVNVSTALILLFGLGQFMRRFGLTSTLLLNPLIAALAFIATAWSPTLATLQVVQVIRRVAQYAIARPSREICFTVVEQDDRYKTKGVIDTVMYRFGDLSSAWTQGGITALGVGFEGALGLGVVACAAWGGVAWGLGRRYAQVTHAQRRANSRRGDNRCDESQMFDQRS